MKCSECGYENKDTAKFCSKCGTNLKEEPVNEPKNNNSKIIIAALVVVIVVLALCIGYFALNNNAHTSDSQPQQSSGSVQSADSSSGSESSQQTTTASKPKQWELIGTYSGSGSGSQSVNVPAGQIMVKLSAYPIKNYATSKRNLSKNNF